MASTAQTDGVGAAGSSEAFMPKARVNIAPASPGGVATDEALELLVREQSGFDRDQSGLDRELTGSLDGGSTGELESPRRFLPDTMSPMPSGPPSFASNRGPSEMASMAQQEFTCVVENFDIEHQEPDPVLEQVPEGDELTHISFEDMLKGVKCLDNGEVFSSVDQIPDTVYTNPAMLKKGSISRAWSGWRQQKNQSDEKLWSACANGSLEVLKAALAQPTDGTPPAQITAPTLHGRAALHIAAEVGRPECVELLLERKASLSQTTNSGLTPLHVASDRNHVEVVRLLLERRADAHAKDNEGQLPVHLAAIKGYSETVKEMLQRGGQGQLGTKNRVGQRPQELCIDVDTLRVFKEHAAQAAASGDCTGDGRFADDYSGRSVLGQTVRRSSRADHVQSLLNLGQRGPSGSNFVSSISYGGEEDGGSGSFGLVKERSTLGSNQEPRASWGGPGLRKPFAKVRLGEAAEKVSPASFEYMDKLGSGSFGDVYLVRHKRSKESYAMKVLNRNRMRSSHLRYAITERNVLSYLRHPYIVQLYYSFQADTRLVLVLQYCCGGDVQGLLNRERFLQEPLAQLYASEVLSALSHIHLRDIVYRDMKPENVLIDKDGHCMLTDFGLSKERVGLEGTKSFCGSLAFIAPELLRRGCAHNRLVDVYGLGVFLYCMLVGIPPHYHRDRDTLLTNIRQARLRFPSSMNPKPQALIRCLMEREPARRPGQRATSEVMEDEFFANIDFEALNNREIPVPVRPSRPTPRVSRPVESQDPFAAAAAPPDPGRGASTAPTADVNAFTFVHVDAAV